MISDLAWRKVPRDIIRNEELAYIADILAPQIPASAPMLFYFVAYCIADDAGVFCIDDGVIFSRLMKTGTPQDVFLIAEQMERRRLIMPVIPGDTYYLIVDWECPERKGSGSSLRTLEERRRFVMKKITEERALQSERVQGANPAVPVNFSSAPQPDIFFMPVNDKNGEFVTKKSMTTNFEKMSPKTVSVTKSEKVSPKSVKTTKNEKMSPKTLSREREEREEREEENLETVEIKDTHTQERERECEGEREEKLRPPPESGLRFSESGQSERAETETETAIDIAAAAQEILDSMSADKGEEKAESGAKSQAYASFRAFFVKNCIALGIAFDEAEHGAALEELSARAARLATRSNSAGIVASALCTSFETLPAKVPYYKTLNITPENLLKPGPWDTVLSLSRKILFASARPAPAWEEEKRRSEEEFQKVQGYLSEQYARYGIDPKDPHAMSELVRKTAAEKNNGRDTS